jgi:transposase
MNLKEALKEIKSLESKVNMLEKEKERHLALIFEQQKKLNALLGRHQVIHEKYMIEKTKPFVSKNEQIKEIVINEAEETIKREKPKKGRKKGGTNFKHVDLEASVTSVRYEDPLFEPDNDVSALKLISEKERYVVEVIPSTIHVTKIIKRTYKCPKTNAFYYPISKEVFPGSVLTPSFAAYIAYHKYELGIPFHHLEAHLSNTLKIDISKQLMSVWMKNMANRLTPVFARMKEDLKQNTVRVIHADETTLVISKQPEKEKDRKKSYVYVYSTSFYDKQIHIYDFHETRSIDQTALWLKDYDGYVVCDDYKGYDKLAKNNDGITLQRCFAHARRRFADILKALPEKERPRTVSYQILELINRLFHFEALYKERRYIASEITKHRHQDQIPVLGRLKVLVFETVPTPNSAFEGALKYVRNIWDQLLTYLDYPYLDISNNLAERAVKPFVINRKVFMTSGSYAGAIYTTKIFSIIRTAVINHLDVEKYLAYVLEHIDHVAVCDLLPYSENLPKHLRMKIKSA